MATAKRENKRAILLGINENGEETRASRGATEEAKTGVK